jgi:hypothetical protein
MKLNRNSLFLWRALTLASVPMLNACQEALDMPSASADQTGELSLPLVTTSASGNWYRWKAQLQITGTASVLLDASGEAATVTQPLAPGSYQIALLPDWQLLRIHDDGTEAPVEAALLGSETQAFEIQTNTVTRAVYRFRAGDEIIVVGAGSAELGFAVEEANAAPGDCTDGSQNGNESDVDCGGNCSPCAPRAACEVDADCANGSCAAGVCGTLLSGIIGDATLTAAASPYVLGSTVQIGGTVQLLPGVEILGRDQALEVYGTLLIQGSSDEPTVLRQVRVIPVGSHAQPARVDIDAAYFEGGTPYSNNGINYATLSLKNSVLRGISGVGMSWPAGSCTIQHNTFDEFGPLHVTAQYSVDILDNYFRQPTGWVGIFVSVALSGLHLNGNTFEPGPQPLLQLGALEPLPGIDASNNYWGITDESAIAALIFDRNDDLKIENTVGFQPFLTSPSATAPVPAP